MTLRRIDRWIGWHMSAKRWVVFWFLVVSCASTMVGSGCLWCLTLVFLAALMFFGNLRRLGPIYKIQRQVVPTFPKAVCPTCRACYSYLGEEAKTKYPCPKCGGELEFPAAPGNWGGVAFGVDQGEKR